MVSRNIISPNTLNTWHSDSSLPLFHNLSLANSFHFHTHWTGYGPLDYFAIYREMTISGRVMRICYTWHCSNKWIVVKWLFSLKISLFHSTLIFPVYNILLLRHHQCRQTSSERRERETCLSKDHHLPAKSRHSYHSYSLLQDQHQSRSQSFVPLDQRSENVSSGSNHYERTKEITEFWLSGSLRICIYGACLKWLLPELSFSDRWSRGTKLWERDWISTWICCCSACALVPVRSSTPIRHFTVTWPPISLAVFN